MTYISLFLQKHLLRFSGLILLCAGILKLFNASYGTLDTILPLGIAPKNLIAVALWEVILGAWLVFGIKSKLGWVCALGTFSLFAIVSFTLTMKGVASCGCFGALKTSPWVSFSISLILLTLLLLFREKVTLESIRHELTDGIVVSSVATFISVIAFYLFFDHSWISAKFRGDKVVAVNQYINFGNGIPGEWKEAKCELKNWTKEPVVVIGGDSGCDYDILKDCPKTINPSETVSFRLRYKLPSKIGRNEKMVSFWVQYDLENTQRIILSLSGVTDNSSQSKVVLQERE